METPSNNPNSTNPTRVESKVWDWGSKDDLHPLFMDQLPDDWEHVDDLAALKHIDNEGTPEECAENEKERGNNQSKLKNFLAYARAIEHYTNALKYKCNNQKLNSQCYSNRAAMNLLLGNY
jgi:hypothetical protein